MADVNLSVEVTSKGVDQAIAAITRLTNAGRDASTAQRMLQQSIAGAGKAAAGQPVTLKAAGKALEDLKTRVAGVREEYTKLAAVNVGGTATDRLAAFGGGSLQQGVIQARLLREQMNAINADPLRDLQALENARASKLSAQTNLEKSRWEASLQGMTAAERAAARLTRAEQEYNAALKASNQTFIQRQGKRGRFLDWNEGELNAQASGMNRLAEAQRELTSAQAEASHTSEFNSDNAFQSSYSYFILAGLATQASQAITNFGGAALGASRDIETSFADVQRTFEGTDGQIRSLRNRLTELSTETPVSIIDLAEIATLGNQLGIAAEDIESFTQVIAQYTAVSGQTAEDAATAFGRISNLTGLAASEYGNLASAITYTARTTVATESTIQNTAKEITALASGAGFSADAIVGLAGSLSSLAIPPERARGALSLYFGALNTAVAEGGPKLQAFAELTNMTAETLNRLVRENRGQEVFTAFISGLSELDTVAKTTALDTLGLSTIRVDQTMRALAQNVPLVTNSFMGANRAFRENTEIASQYAIIQDTLGAKWQQFQNSVQNAAGALGDRFSDAAKTALTLATQLLVTLEKFANSPIGSALLTLIGYIAALVAALASLIGVLSLSKASLVVMSFAVSQLGWTSATKGIQGWIASLFAADAATRKAALSTTGMGVALRETSIYSKLSGASLTGFTNAAKAAGLAMAKFALATAAIVAVSAVIGDLNRQANYTKLNMEALGDGVEALGEAMRVDNAKLFSRSVNDTAVATDGAAGSVTGMNAALIRAASAQIDAKGATDNTTDSIKRQQLAVGEATKAWVASAIQQSDAVQKLLKGEKSDMPIIGGLFDVKARPDELRAALVAGLDLEGIGLLAYSSGSDAAMELYDGWITELQAKASAGNADAKAAIEAMGGLDLRNVLVKPLADGIDAAASEALVALKLAGTTVVAVASDFDQAGNYIGEFSGQLGETLVTFEGATNQLSAFREALGSAMQETVGFGGVLKRAESAAEEIAAAFNEANKGADMKPPAIDVTLFSKSLQEATDEALSFYDGMVQLAEGGNMSFALQLAGLGTEAQPILASALEADPATLAQIEADARFAAFIGSQAFADQLEAEMQGSNEAYARIFSKTGSLETVREYIAAQVAGTGAEWERQWAMQNPELPLNVTPELKNPTEEQVSAWGALMDGRITVKAAVHPASKTIGDAIATEGAWKQYIDSASGATITLPANLDDQTLSQSLTIWQEHQNASPKTLQAKLDEAGLTNSLAGWVSTRPPIQMRAAVTPYLTTQSLGSIALHGVRPSVGGMIGSPNYKIPKFAKGGGWFVSGPGSGTSDSIPAMISAGEYVNTAKSVKFWGPDFFDSLNRKMLPASFVSALGAAANSGNQGPQSVTHVAVTQNNPVTRDSLKQLREDSEMVAAGIWN